MITGLSIIAVVIIPRYGKHEWTYLNINPLLHYYKDGAS